MSDFESKEVSPAEETAEEPRTDAVDSPVEGSVAEEAACAPAGPRWKRVVKRVFIGIGVTIVSLVVLGVLVYNYGGMSGSAVPGVEDQFKQMVASGQAQPIQKRFVIPIPGCQCHSTDPVLTAQHSRRRMTECAKCHNTNPPHMEPGVL